MASVGMVLTSDGPVRVALPGTEASSTAEGERPVSLAQHEPCEETARAPPRQRPRCCGRTHEFWSIWLLRIAMLVIVLVAAATIIYSVCGTVAVIKFLNEPHPDDDSYALAGLAIYFVFVPLIFFSLLEVAVLAGCGGCALRTADLSWCFGSAPDGATATEAEDVVVVVTLAGGAPSVDDDGARVPHADGATALGEEERRPLTGDGAATDAVVFALPEEGVYTKCCPSHPRTVYVCQLVFVLAMILGYGAMFIVCVRHVPEWQAIIAFFAIKVLGWVLYLVAIIWLVWCTGKY